jgi:hypothetical protein
MPELISIVLLWMILDTGDGSSIVSLGQNTSQSGYFADSDGALVHWRHRLRSSSRRTGWHS